MQLLTLPGDAGDVIGLWHSPTGDRLAVVTAELVPDTDYRRPSRLVVYNLASDRIDHTHDIRTARSTPPTISPDFSYHTAGLDLVRWTTGRRVTLGFPPVPDYQPPTPYVALTVSPDGATVYGASYLFVDRWDVRGAFDRSAGTVPPSGERLGAYRADVLAVSPTGDELVAGARAPDGPIVFRWRLPEGAPLDPLRTPGLHGVPRVLAYSPDGRTLAVGCIRGVHLCDRDAVEPRRTLPDRGVALAFTPDGSRLLTTAWVGEATVWDVTDGTEMLRYEFADIGELRAVSVAPDGLTAVAGGTEGRLVRWDL